MAKQNQPQQGNSSQSATPQQPTPNPGNASPLPAPAAAPQQKNSSGGILEKMSWWILLIASVVLIMLVIVIWQLTKSISSEEGVSGQQAPTSAQIFVNIDGKIYEIDPKTREAKELPIVDPTSTIKVGPSTLPVVTIPQPLKVRSETSNSYLDMFGWNKISNTTKTFIVLGILLLFTILASSKGKSFTHSVYLVIRALLICTIVFLAAICILSATNGVDSIGSMFSRSSSVLPGVVDKSAATFEDEDVSRVDLSNEPLNGARHEIILPGPSDERKMSWVKLRFPLAAQAHWAYNGKIEVRDGNNHSFTEVFEVDMPTTKLDWSKVTWTEVRAMEHDTILWLNFTPQQVIPQSIEPSNVDAARRLLDVVPKSNMR